MSTYSNQTAAFWLILMTINNISVTLINKAIFSTIIHFPYPYMLTVIHMIINYIACQYIFYTIQISTTNNNNNNNNNSNGDSSKNKSSTNIWIQLLGNSDDLHTPPTTTTKTSSSSSTTSQQSSSSSSLSSIISSLYQYIYTYYKNNFIIGIYSILFSMNIAIGNVSLQHVSINFNQMMRSLVPIITLVCTKYIQQHNNTISIQRQIAIYSVVFGVAISTIGDRMNVTIIGFIYTLLCVILASIKVVASSELLTGNTNLLKIHPLRLLHRMAPLALLQCFILSILSGEFHLLYTRWYIDIDPLTTGSIIPILVLLFSGILAFSLNICALQAYKVTSPLTCCIAAAVKQVLMIVIGTYMFHTPITTLNGCGIIIVLIGSTYYSYIAIIEPKHIPIIHKSSSSLDSANTNNNSKNDSIQQNTGIDLVESHDNDIVDDGSHHHHHHNNKNDDTIELGIPLLRPTATATCTSPPSSCDSNNNNNNTDRHASTVIPTRR